MLYSTRSREVRLRFISTFTNYVSTMFRKKVTTPSKCGSASLFTRIVMAAMPSADVSQDEVHYIMDGIVCVERSRFRVNPSTWIRRTRTDSIPHEGWS
mmetsp:Transcript_7828/g.15761  ORF Transcript_7828/g.15761 Transcript_7828/m.15761 type:complete len:98 (-) Transcript_7828:64-357(-)